MAKLKIGPGALVAAAFIGPGTVTACTLAGANFGYALLWGLTFATLSTIVLQEMAARLGTVTGLGLGETLRTELAGPLKWPMFALVGVALYAGNAAYEGGNLSGAALGLAAAGLTGAKFEFVIAGVALVAASLLWFGGYRLIERVLVALVCVMAVAFLASALVVGIDWSAVVAGLFIPSLPEGSLLTAVALIGTTVVPYNLFLHASAAKARWHANGELRAARADTAVSVGLGGLISILIAATAAASLFGEGLQVTSAVDMSVQLRPLAGEAAPVLLGAGLLAAGLTSSITAPLATGYAVAEVLGWPAEARSRGVKLVALSVVAVGTALALAGVKPVEVIFAAQVANGILLPVIVAFLLFAMNRRRLLGKAANGALANLLGGAVLIVTTGLGARALALAFDLI